MRQASCKTMQGSTTHKEASKRASKQAMKQTSKQASKQVNQQAEQTKNQDEENITTQNRETEAPLESDVRCAEMDDEREIYICSTLLSCLNQA
jgi:hypothetical protein